LPALPLTSSASLASNATGDTNTLSPSDLDQRMVESRAVEAVIWGMPAVNFDLLYRATAPLRRDVVERIGVVPRPQAEILDGSWKFPEAQPVS